MRRSWLALVALVACEDATPPPTAQLNLDHPVDVAFACYGGLRLTDGNPPTADQEITVSAQPVEACNIRSSAAPSPAPPGQEAIPGAQAVPGATWFAFILQSVPGNVALARFETKPAANFVGKDVQIQDIDQLMPGVNGISVGEDPVAIATDRVGCYEVIANQGSCDLSTLSVDSVFTGDPQVNRLEVKNALGQVIRARPAAMAFEPAGGVIGRGCPATPTGLAYIAYPSCHLVAGVDVATGTIVTGIQFDAAGLPTIVDGTVSCPAECDGAPRTPGVRPVALDLELDTRSGRAVLAIGADNSNVLTIYDLDNTLFRPLSLTSIPLLDTTGRLGITSVAVSPLIGMGGNLGVVDDSLATGGDHQYAYAVANDRSVRVADLSGAPRECDTQVDPRYLRDVRDVDALSCFAVGAVTTPPRRAGARGPGIELVGDGIPTSVDVFRTEGTGPTPQPNNLIGYFGVITSSNGKAYVFAIDDDNHADYVDATDGRSTLTTPIPLDIAHQLRDGVPDRGRIAEHTKKVGPPGMEVNVAYPVCGESGPDPDAQGGLLGGPRSVAPPTQTGPSGVIAIEKSGGLPSIRQVLCSGFLDDGNAEYRPVSELQFSAPLDVRDAVFPDLVGLRSDETWSLTWEGSLSTDRGDVAIDGPAVRISQLRVDGLGIHLFDDTHPYCDAGVQPYDVVQLRGCDPSIGDAGCPIGYTCYVHPQSQVTGIGACMLSQEAEQFSAACKGFLTSLRRYTVGRATTGQLQLLPRKHVLRTTPVDGCIDDAQCKALADYAIKNASPAHPIEDPTQPDSHTWACRVDGDRAPLGGTGKRCLMTCTTDADCAVGTVCQGGYCLEGVTPPQSCVNAPQRYELRGGEAFVVVGSRQGYIHPIIADVGGNCVKDPNANQYQVGRIPLVVPPCDPAADPRTGRRMDGTFEPNPCQLTVPETEYQLNYEPGTCTLVPNDNERLVTRDANAIRLRNRALQLTIVDPTYQGDARCNGDRAGTLVNVPLVSPGYQIAFRQTAGFVPLSIGLSPPAAFPIKVLRGPTQSIWIVDEGDFLSTSPQQASTRGKVFRIETTPGLGGLNLVQ